MNLTRLGSVLFFVLLGLFVLVGVLLVHFESANFRQNELAEVQQKLDVMRASLKSRLYANIYKVSAVQALVAMNPDLTQDDFARAMEVQFRGEHDLRNIGLARDMVLQWMYPIEGNEAAVGLDYRRLPDQLEAVNLSLRLNEIVVAGPLSLVQGGEGLIARIPIHITDASSNEGAFWGFASVVMNSEALISGAGIIKDHDFLRVAIRGRDALGEKGEVFWGDTTVFDHHPVTQMIELPYGSWQIGAVPLAGWSAYTLFSTPLMWTYLVVVLIVLAFTAVLLLLFRRINETENERTILSRSLEAILDQTSDFIYYKDHHSRFICCSQTLADITHHTHWKDMIGKHDFEVFPHDVATIYHDEEAPIFKEGTPLLNKVDPYYTEDGQIGYVQTNKWPVLDDHRNVVGIFGISRDITAHKIAVEALEKERNLFAEGPVFTMEWEPEPSGNWPLRSVSSNVETILGYTAEEMLHPELSFPERIHPDDVAQITSELDCHIENRIHSFEQSYRLQTKSGKYLWVHDFTMLIRDEEGNLTGIRSYMYDQSAQKEAEEALRIAEARLEKTAYDLTENIPIGTYTMVQPPHGGMASFEFMSRRFLELTGLTREEAASDPMKAFACVHPDDFDAWVALNAKAFENKAPFFGETRVIADGEVRWITAESNPRTLDDGTTVWEGVLADITESKRLKDRIIEEKEKAQAATIAKSQFLANMSHEIRTPLNGVIGFTDLLKSTELSPMQEQYVEAANVSGHTLLGIINDILDFSKIEAGMMELERIRTDMVELLENSVDIVKFSAGQKNLEILLDIDSAMPCYAMVDPVRLKQILANLLGNAVKFTEKGEIELNVTYDPVEAHRGTFCISVRDTGIGIAEDQIEHMFQAFSQADSSTTRKYGGTGLGLSISSMLAKKMGSEIRVNSTPGTGTTFSFELTTEVDQNVLPADRALSSVKRCLIIDDNTRSREILEAVLTQWEIECESCDQGLEAIKILKGPKPFDCILCDDHMPGIDGLETIRRIREELNLPPEKQPILLLHSSSGDAQLYAKSEMLGVRCCMTKPVKRAQLWTSLAVLHERSASCLGDRFNQPDAFLQPDSSDLGPGKQIAFLVAEDVPMNMMLTKSLLKKTIPKAMIVEAENGKEALQKYRETPLSMILMDVQMPEMDGLEATRAIRELEYASGKHIPIIALTAGAMKEEMERCYEAGMDDFLTKPIDQKKLTRLISTLAKPVKAEEMRPTAVHFDRKQLIDGYGKDDVSEIISIARTEIPAQIESISLSMQSNDREALKTHLHKLKGIALNFCVPHMSALVVEIEQRVINGDDASLLKYKITELFDEWIEIEKELMDS